MTALTEVFVTVKPDTDKFGPEVKKKLAKIDASKEGKQVATRFGVGLNGAMGSIVSKSAGIFAAGFAVIQGAKVFGGFIKEAAESEKISRITANAIKATGGAAKISADQVSALATSISNKTAIDDEQIQSAANMLLTFKNIRNETGKGNDVFNQATQAAADLSVQFGGIDGASKQLGKALNDPIKGTTALAKAGVTFTEQQKKQIKTLVESGNVLGAQKIILKEIEGQVGGAAAAAADPMERLKVVAGNLGESIGGLLLPVVNKFSTFLTSTAIPGIYALGAAFQGEGVTSDGFVGFMERVGVAARTAFRFFKTEVLPRLREFAGFVTGSVIPAVAGFATNLASTLAPIISTVFGFISTEVIPRLRDFAVWLTPIIEKAGELAGTLSKNKDFLVPFVATLATGVVVFQAVTLAIKAWAAVQAVLNVVLTANPIGLVIVAVAALVAGVIYAYKHSEKFREILQGAFQGIQKAAQTFAPLVRAAIGVVIAAFSLWWNNFAKPILERFGAMLAVAWGLAQRFGQVVSAGFNAIREPARAAIAYVIGRFLGFVQTLLDGAAKAFGWVPQLGGKLKAAASEFGKFRDSVNGKLNGITDQTINVAIKYSSKGVNLTTPSSVGRMAAGGGVFGGVRGKDSVPALLMPDEHVWTTKEVSAAGGHGAMKRMREAALRGELHGYAAGGPVRFNVTRSAPSSAALAKEIASHALKAAGPYIAAGAKQIAASGPGGPPGARKSFRGVTLNTRTINMLLNAERLLGAAFHITQGSYSTRVAASGSTHAGGGAMDTNGPRGWSAAVKALRAAGFAAWHRTPSQGPWNHHIHSIALGDSSASAAAKAQMASFRRGGNGLGGMAKGGAVTKQMARDLGIDTFDTGGRWRSGTLAANTSGKTETVVRGGDTMTVRLSDQDRRLLEAVAARPIELDGNRLDTAMAKRSWGR